MTGRNFWQWFSTNCDELGLSTDTRKAVDVIHQRLRLVDSRLGVEVSEPDDSGSRELIITANGHRQLFGEVDNLVQIAPKLDGWRFISLKPPRGFDFRFKNDDHALSPSGWKVLPLHSPGGDLGLSIFVPGSKVLIHEPILEVIVETGVGERAFAEVCFLEYTQDHEELAKHSWLDIRDLGTFLTWRRTKKS
jgi:hypothetical protein